MADPASSSTDPQPNVNSTSTNTITNITGGVNIDAYRLDIGGDVVGRDKIVTNIQHIYERALTAVEEAEQRQDVDLKHLAAGVSTFAQRLRARASESPDIANPYKGLLEYRLSDAEIFFGRDDDIREVLQHLDHGLITILHSESGAGKTSLLQAGISSRLIATGHLPIYLRPYNISPILALKQAFLPNLDLTPVLAKASLRDFLWQICKVLESSIRIYILLDQFEEFFTQVDEPNRADFVRELAQCLDDPTLNVRWVMSLRSEYFASLADFRPRIRNPFENDYRLNRLTRAEAQAAVTKPAERRGIDFEPGLIETILDDLGGNEISPPEVQLVCSALYEGLETNAMIITRRVYDQEGGAAGILRGYLERVLNRDFQPTQRDAARRVLEALVTSESQRAVRTQAELSLELGQFGITLETINAILDQLVDSRLLRRHEEGIDGNLVYELVHDYLLAEIKLDPEVQARKAAQELLDQEVRAHRRYATSLISEDRLSVIEQYRTQLVFTSEAEQLFRMSKEAAQKRRKTRERQRRSLLTGAIATAILMTLLAIFGLNQSLESRNQASIAQAASTKSVAESYTRATAEAVAKEQEGIAKQQRDEAQAQARIARSKELAGQALNAVGVQYDLALLLSVQANRVADTPESKNALLEVLERKPQLRRYFSPTSKSVSRGIAVDPDRHLLASITCLSPNAENNCAASIVNIQDLNTGKLAISSVTVTASLMIGAFSPDGQDIAMVRTTFGKHDVILWDVGSGQITKPALDHNALSLAFSPDGKVLATGGVDSRIMLWDVATGRQIKHPLVGNTTWVTSLAYSPDGRYLASGSMDGMIVIWDTETDSLYKQPLIGHTQQVSTLVFSPDGKLLVSTSFDGNIAFWDLDSHALISLQRLISVTSADYLASGTIAFSPDGRTLAVSSVLNQNAETSDTFLSSITLWDVATRRPVRQLSQGPNVPVYKLVFDKTGRTLIANYYDNTTVIWDINAQRRTGVQLPQVHREWVRSVAVSPDGHFVASGSYDGSIGIWDVTTGKLVGQPLVSRYGGVSDVAFSPDGTTLISANGNSNIVLWDLQKRQELNRIHDETISLLFGVAFAPDGKRIAFVADKKVVVWDLTQWKKITDIPVHDRFAVEFSPDNNFLLFAGSVSSGAMNNAIVLWNTLTNEETSLPGVRLGSASATFSPDSSRLAAADNAGGIAIWDLATYKLLNWLSEGSGNMVVGVTFSRDGKILASSTCTRPGIDSAGLQHCLEGEIVLWDMATFKPVGRIPAGNAGAVSSLAFSSGSYVLASNGSDNTIILWNMDPDYWKALACYVANRNLTQAEWDQYLGSDLPYEQTCPDQSATDMLALWGLFSASSTPISVDNITSPAPPQATTIVTPVVPITTPTPLRTEVTGMPSGLSLAFSALVQCRENADSKNFTQDYLGMWAVHVDKPNEWIPQGEAQVVFGPASGIGANKYDIKFSLAPNETGWLITERNMQGYAMRDVLPTTGIVQLDIHDVVWKPISGTLTQYRYDVVLQSHSTYGNTDYPQHAAMFKVQNLSNSKMSKVELFGVVQDHKGNAVDILYRGGGADLAPDQIGYFVIKSFSPSGRCVGGSDKEGYILHYWLDFQTEEGQLVTRYYTTKVQ